MNVETIRHYRENSAEAVARVLATLLIADGRLSDSELRHLDNPYHMESLGLQPGLCRKVLRAHLVDLALASPSMDSVRLNAPEVLDQVLGELTDPGLQIKACALALDAIAADEVLTQDEHAVFLYMLKTWKLTLADVLVSIEHRRPH